MMKIQNLYNKLMSQAVKYKGADSQNTQLLAEGADSTECATEYLNVQLISWDPDGTNPTVTTGVAHVLAVTKLLFSVKHLTCSLSVTCQT